jgi:LmbE family N-acetylglucosaminyl deacetylase
MTPDLSRVLIVVAHPDDDVLAFGGLISTQAARSTFRILYLAEGISPRINGAKPNSVQLQGRNSGIRFLKNFGIDDFHFYENKCGSLSYCDPIPMHRKIVEHITDFQPTIICTTSITDNHSDHRAVFDMTMVAARPIGNTKTISIFSGEILSSTEWRFTEAFSPNIFLPLSESSVNDKCLMLESYPSEVRDYPFPRSRLGVETLARFRGMQSGNEFAEAYTLIRGAVFA